MFHWKDGWHFGRNDDGSVLIIKKGTDHSFEATIPGMEWASIVHHVAAPGVNYQSVQDMQMSGGIFGA